ncbi:hypothetical protein K7432_005275 [Basidiobolus ranarum]|uniref:Uncharacterized protein n=1 Tax=Basidiobolus ranarum TaxID=34480 RepID=A0ABR2WWZ8_9FUNG
MFSLSKYLTVITLILAPLVVRGLDIPNVPDCNICFSVLPEGCREIMGNAKTSTANGLRAMTECMCTDEYFTAFKSCSGCSAKAMGHFTKSATEEDFKQTQEACKMLLEHLKKQKQ